MSRRGRYCGAMGKLREEHGNACKAEKHGLGKCSAKAPLHDLEFAHVKPTGLSGRGRGLAARYHDIKRNPDCYDLFCKPHHKAFDRDYWRRVAAEREATTATSTSTGMPDELVPF